MKPPLIALAFFWLMAGCAPNTPSDVATAYLASLSERQFDKAASLVSEEGRPVLLNIESSYRLLSPDEQVKFQVRNWKIENVTQNGDSASVDFSYDAYARVRGRLQATLWLVRKAGVWRVDLKRPL